MTRDENGKRDTTMAITITFMVHAGVVIALRLYSRIRVTNALGMDDILISFAVVSSWAFGVFILCNCAKNHLGRHIEHFEAWELEQYSILIWAGAMAYNTCLGFIKLSVLSLYLRISPNRLFRRCTFFMMFIIAAQAISNLVTVIFQCMPIESLWNTAVKGRCININAFYLANAALTIATDIATYALPMPMLSKLQLPKRQKFGLIAILGLGGFACISSIVRITYVVPMLSSADGPYVIVEPLYWSVIEINVGILACSIPSFKALFKRYLPGFLGGVYTNNSDATPRAKRLSYPLKSWERKILHGIGRNETCITGQDQEEDTVVDGRFGRTGSEERIIPDGKIMRTTNIVVAHGERDDSSSRRSDRERVSPSR